MTGREGKTQTKLKGREGKLRKKSCLASASMGKQLQDMPLKSERLKSRVSLGGSVWTAISAVGKARE